MPASMTVPPMLAGSTMQTDVASLLPLFPEQDEFIKSANQPYTEQQLQRASRVAQFFGVPYLGEEGDGSLVDLERSEEFPVSFSFFSAKTSLKSP